MSLCTTTSDFDSSYRYALYSSLMYAAMHGLTSSAYIFIIDSFWVCCSHSVLVSNSTEVELRDFTNLQDEWKVAVLKCQSS